MDPSGIIGIIGVVAHILTTCSKLGLSWRDAPEDAKKFKSEMDGLHKTLLETYNHLIQNPDFISAFEGKHSAVLSNLATPSSPGDANLLSACQEELDHVLKGLKKQISGSRFGWERFKAMLSGERTQSAIENLQRRCQVINSMISIDNTTLAVNTNLEIRSTRKQLSEMHLDERKREILDWITPLDFASQQTDNLERRQEGTGQWLLDSPEFRTWVQEDRKTLFCPGMPGAGKTMLSSIVIEDLQNRVGGDPEVGIAYLFCNFRRHHEQKPRDLLASVLKQLYWAMPAGPNEVEEAYDQHLLGTSPMSTQEIVRCIQSVTMCFAKVYILVDALDECRRDEGYLDTLLTTILGLAEAANVNCFATSRHIPEIESYFDGAISIEIQATDDDVMKFLDGHMSKLPLAVKKSMELQGEIKNRIIQAVQGMFLLAQLHLDSLQGKRSAKAIRDSLHKLANGSAAYDVAYNEAMERIEGQLTDQESLAKDALSWIVCASRPLKTLELQHALAVEQGTTELDEDNIPELEDIVSVCAGLVTIDQESQIIRLVHYTTQEYFERTTERWLPNAERLIVRSCVTYVSFAAFSCSFESYYEQMEKDDSEGYDSSFWVVNHARLSKNPLYGYAARNWAYHTRKISPPDEDTLQLLRNTEHTISSLNHVLWVDVPYSTRAPPRNVRGLHLAAYFGLIEIFESLTRSDTEVDINIADSYGVTPLSYAIKGGSSGAAPGENEDFLKYLLARSGLDPNKASRLHDFSPLHDAAIYGNKAAVRELIRMKGIRLNAKDDSDSTPLHEAIRTHHFEIIRLLVETGKVDLGAQDNEGLTPFSKAVAVADEDVIQYLLETGMADTSSTDNEGKTPLHHAVRRIGLDKAVQYMLDSGMADASLFVEDNSGQTPFEIAVEESLMCEGMSEFKNLIEKRMNLVQGVCSTDSK
nr:ankyrin repeat protein [Colletotrichum truncatum]KAF6791303.1 ankyrin repeat protein [Colletotrichum truncatum]